MLGTFTPSIERSGPRASTFDGDIVYTSANSKETAFTPVSAPRITDGPVLLSILGNTETNYRYVLNNVEITSIITVNATGVFFKGHRNCDSTSDGSSLVNFLNHVFFA